ncbi:HIT family protein [Siculibacillus lacustris]|uniref:HIT family protein n=1 Tax=Siculibacillus lacustris TaxID=1549641 RepID=A0A4Q9VGX9_9HYPH|nr:HIT family protein [Siculibacillus lacustris]TBW34315.1 HIT family protein [Siculibacillus lacustris]
MTPAYDDANVFAKILRGEIPAHVVWEDDHTLAFMDVMPAVDGHTLVIPKAKARNIFDVRPADLARVISVVQMVAVAARTAFIADGATIQQFNETAGGQEVFHLHFHILPRQSADRVRPLPRPFADPKILAAHAEAIRAALATR